MLSLRLSQVKYETGGSLFSRLPRHYHSPSRRALDSARENSPSRQISESELEQILLRIERGEMRSVCLTERAVDDRQFLRIVISSETPGSKVTEIIVSGNRIGDSCIQQLVSVLSQNTKIKTLNLAHNRITSHGVGFLIDILQKNLVISNIDLSGQSIDEGVLKQMQEFLGRNCEISEELGKKEHYSMAFTTLSTIGFPIGVSNIVLEYFNGASHPQARAHIQTVLYPYNSSLPKNNGVGTNTQVIIEESPNQSLVRRLQEVNGEQHPAISPSGIDRENSEVRIGVGPEHEPLLLSNGLNTENVQDKVDAGKSKVCSSLRNLCNIL